ncbi:hypothetical protein P154DRAFT_580794 [Amniculicola lignicola CBS 123094]|uniref:Amino acid permease/ SLC12A domain-containing protein n=1 Tax=Amniculicola lignicola CBS 123094 TaxID=1392246 RepID=A0A6A5W2M1_9PLEO|nr:hypothetical protein P154DRAFT_580794 [Amniculicola lignicola CBS 123094]
MLACRPLTGALIDFPHRFLDPACGFAVAASYTLANICSMATLTAQSAELTALLKDEPQRHKIGIEVVINLSLIVLTTFSHCLGVKLYGKIERVIMWFKLSLFILAIVLMIVINSGGGGPREGSYRGNYTNHAFTPGFKPTGFANLTEHNLHSSGVDDSEFGIGGPGGQLFAFLTAVTIAMFSCSGGEMIAMTAGEAKRPFKDVPIVMSFVYIVPLTLYPFVLMAAGANVNYADPNLPKMWSAGSGRMSQSPFVVAVQESSLHGLPKVLNAFFIVSAYTAANTALYVASRSCFMLSQQYGTRWMRKTLGRTNDGHTPLASILFCSFFGFLSLSGLSQYAYSQPRITLSEFYTGAIACVYICECFTFLNFKAGLDRLCKRKILTRDERLYKEKLFKSRWQPIPAYVGIVGCTSVIIWSGIPPLYILIAKGSLTSTSGLKSTAALAFDVVGAYIGPVFFLSCYYGYKFTKGSCRVDIRRLTSDQYVIGDLSIIERNAPPKHDRKPSDSGDSYQDPDAFELESPRDSRLPDLKGKKAVVETNSESRGELTDEMREEMKAEMARKEERRGVVEILRRRPKRMDRGFWRELWSFVIVDKDDQPREANAENGGDLDDGEDEDPMDEARRYR